MSDNNNGSRGSSRGRGRGRERGSGSGSTHAAAHMRATSPGRCVRPFFAVAVAFDNCSLLRPFGLSHTLIAAVSERPAWPASCPAEILVDVTCATPPLSPSLSRAMLTDLQCAFLATYQMLRKTIESASAGYSRHPSRPCLAIGHCPLSPTLSLLLSFSGQQGAVGAVKSPGEKQLNGSRAEPVTRAFLMDTIDRHKGGTASRQGGEERGGRGTAQPGLGSSSSFALLFRAALEEQQQKTNERTSEGRKPNRLCLKLIRFLFMTAGQRAGRESCTGARDPGGDCQSATGCAATAAVAAAAGWLRVAIAKHCRRLPLPECGDNACSLC